MSRPSQTEVAYVQTFVRSPDFRAFMSRLSCVHQTFVRSCPDFRLFLMFPDYVILNARRPPRAFIFGLDILASVWDLNLGPNSVVGQTEQTQFWYGPYGAARPKFCLDYVLGPTGPPCPRLRSVWPIPVLGH